MRVIAFDIGTVRVGVAVSDALGLTARACGVRERSEDPAQDARDLAQMAREYDAEGIIVGMPVSLRGQHEIAAQHMAAFIELLQAATDLPVTAWDERMTTAIAQRVMLEAGERREARRQKIDQVAATVILQSYLDSQHRQPVGGASSPDQAPPVNPSGLEAPPTE
jgi:putative holliday junction resolvase